MFLSWGQKIIPAPILFYETPLLLLRVEYLPQQVLNIFQAQDRLLEGKTPAQVLHHGLVLITLMLLRQL